MEIREVLLGLKSERRALELFLAEAGLGLDADLEYAVAAWEGGRMTGCGALAGPVLKCLAVAPSERGTGLASSLVSRLIAEEQQRGRSRLFIYTKPENEPLFVDMGFSVVERSLPEVCLLENSPNGFVHYLARLKEHAPPTGLVSSAVVNCNPFTRGHRHLLERAAGECDALIVFVVEEDRSAFPSDVRFRLVKNGMADLANVKVIQGGPYVISAATFPSYFIRESADAVEAHARLDLRIFGRRIAPVLGLVRRCVGEEPFDEVTAVYNRVMREMLPGLGVELRIIPRLEAAGRAISASRVRELLRSDDFAAIRPLVPDATYEYLTSEEARPVLAGLKRRASRH